MSKPQPFSYFCRKLIYYVRWYEAMSETDRKSWLGDWVIERIGVFTNIIKTYEQAMAQFHRPVGNYKTEL